MERKFGLLGRRLSHSWSPEIHAMLCGYEYGLYEVEPDGLESFLATTELSGLNVTIPYKRAVMPYCVSLSDAARRIGSVNTLVRTPTGFHGDNTDLDGFLAMVRSTGVSVSGKKALVFGTGGASLAVRAALDSLGAEPVVSISRSGADNYDNLDRHADARVLVNATPLGMYPDTGASPASLDAFPDAELVLDVVYNPARTKLLLDAETRGIPRAGGLIMLVAQARRSAEQFAGVTIPDGRVYEIAEALEKKTRNIILIGMPGCGKSTVGRLLAERLRRPFYDADALIAERADMTIPEIFAREGEEGFRRRETDILSELGRGSGAVIATGGGCVTRAENYPLLHQNGVIVYLTRSLEKLPSNGRPLSQSVGAAALYEARRPLYETFSDHIIDNDGAWEDTLERLTEVLL